MNQPNNSDSWSNVPWLPFSNDADHFNQCLSELGFDTTSYRFTYTFPYTTEDDNGWTKDAVGVILLYPTAINNNDGGINQNLGESSNEDNANSTWFMKDRDPNTCGLVSILHILGNLKPELRSLVNDPTSYWKFFEEYTINLNALSKFEKLYTDFFAKKMNNEINWKNQPLDEVDDLMMNHFIAIMEIDDKIIELDGRKSGPIEHGSSFGEGNLVKDAWFNVMKNLVGESNEFTMLALVPTHEKKRKAPNRSREKNRKYKKRNN